MSEMMYETDPESLLDWFKGRCHRAVKSLQETVTALDEVLIMGKWP